MSPKDPLPDVVEGAVSAVVKLSLEGIKKLVKKFKNREIAFVQDPGIIKKIKEDLKSNELRLYRSYIERQEVLTPMVMGLALRRLEAQKDIERIDALREKLLARYDIGGVHIAQAVQNGIISRYIAYLMDTHASEQIMKTRLLNFLENIDMHACFVTNYTDIIEASKKVIIKLQAHSPEVFVISGMGNTTEKTASLIKKVDKEKTSNYYRENYSRDNRCIAFFHKIVEK